MSKYDVIVIGGGHNGLTAATTLAKKNKKVLLLEKQDQLGGLATMGILHDTSLVRTSIVKELGLGQYGLELTGAREPVMLLGKEGQEVLISGNPKTTSESIAKYSKNDAVAYLELRTFLDKITPLLNGLMNEVPPDVKNLGMKEIWSLGKKALTLKMLGDETMLEFLRIAPMCVADYLNEWFETDFIKAGLAAPALYGSFTGPWSAGSNLNFLLYECLAKEQVIGGAPALIEALQKAAESKGVEIRTSAEVSEIIIENESAIGVTVNGEVINADVVMSSCSPKQTMLDRIAAAEVSFDIETQLNVLRSRGTTAIASFLYTEAVTLKGGVARSAVYRTGNSFDEMERAFDSSKYRQYSANPLMEIRIQYETNTINVMVHYAPYDLEGGWTDKAKARLLKAVSKELSLYTEIKSEPLSTEIITPVDLEDNFGIPGGHIYHAEHAIDQLITRPFPSFMQYKTSIQGLYHCGSGAHPGGGLTCAPGFLAASVV